MCRRTMRVMAVLVAFHFSSAMAAKRPLKVYVLAGQSNMEGHAKIETFDYIGDDPKTAPLLKKMRSPDGKPRICERVWISYLTGSPDRGTLGEGFGKLTAGYGSRRNPKEDGGKIGPEFMFGITIAMPEFKGSVAAVQTAPFYDMALDAIERKHSKVRQMAYFLRTKHKAHANKDGTMTKEQQRACLKEYRAKLITSEEDAFRRRAASHQGYHYFGSAKTFAQIGKAFAEAMLKMEKK